MAAIFIKVKRMQFISKESIMDLKNSGVTSRQLLCPNNSNSNKVTITEVHLQPNAEQPRHRHENAEQIWYCMKGHGKLLLDDTEQNFTAGDVVRFEQNDVHGLKNHSGGELVYLSVTSPPVDFSYAYTKS